jgi:hypothetical protein
VEIVPPVLGVVPQGWQRVFAKVLAKQPQQRYSTCIAFIRDLMDVTTEIDKDDRRELLGILHLPSGEPAMPPLLSKAHDETAPVPSDHRRSRAPLMIAAAAALAVGGGGAWLFLKGRGAESFQLNTHPPNAQVYVDEKLQEGLSPMVIALRPGQKLRIERKGFIKQEMVHVAGKALPSVVKLEPVIREILIQSVPAGATVNVDGEIRGITPVKVLWNEGEKVKLTLSKGDLVFPQDYEPGETPEGKILGLGGEGEKQRVIDAKSDGFLRVAGAYPVRAKVDGKDMGELTGSSQTPLPPGKHKLELSAPKVFYRAVQTVTIQPGQTTSIPLPALARIQIETFPGSDMILIDGQPTGVESTGSDSITVAKGTHVIGFARKPTKHTVEVTGDGKLPKIKL